MQICHGRPILSAFWLLFKYFIQFYRTTMRSKCHITPQRDSMTMFSILTLILGEACGGTSISNIGYSWKAWGHWWWSRSTSFLEGGIHSNNGIGFPSHQTRDGILSIPQQRQPLQLHPPSGCHCVPATGSWGTDHLPGDLQEPPQQNYQRESWSFICVPGAGVRPAVQISRLHRSSDANKWS